MKKILFSLFSLAMFASCSSDMEENVAGGDEFNGNVTLTSKPFEFEDETRTSLTNTGSSIEFAWDEDEAIGIFPIAPTTNNQAKQVLNNENCKGTSSTFDGAGWALLKGNTYAAYYPYQDNNYSDYTKISVDMTGQVQDGNGSLAHIGKEFDYMYSVASVPENGIVNFTFDHICAIIMLELTMPEAATWSNIKVANTNNNKVFTTKGTMNVSNGTVTSTSTSTYLDISLNNVNTAAANEKIIVYLAMLPCNPETVVITATSSLGVRYSASITPKAVLAGKAYKWSASFVEVPTNANGHALVDLGLSVKWATMNIGASSPTDYGGYYAWGETVAKTYFDKSNYKHYKSVYISIPIEDEDGFTSFEETEEYGYIKYYYCPLKKVIQNKRRAGSTL